MSTPENQISKQEQLQNLLRNLRMAIPELRGAFIAAKEGLPIVHLLPAETDALRASAMAATAQGLGNRIVEMLKCGQLTEISVGGSGGLVFIYAAGPQCVLGVLAQNESNIGLIHIEARECAQKIADLIG